MSYLPGEHIKFVTPTGETMSAVVLNPVGDDHRYLAAREVDSNKKWLVKVCDIIHQDMSDRVRAALSLYEKHKQRRLGEMFNSMFLKPANPITIHYCGIPITTDPVFEKLDNATSSNS